MASPRRVDVPHSSERGLDPAGDLSEEGLEGGHPLLVDDNAPSLIVRVAVAEHEDVLDHGLSQEVGLLRVHRLAWTAGRRATWRKILAKGTRHGSHTRRPSS